MKIAYWSALSPRSGDVADYGAQLLPYLAREAEIGVFVDGYAPDDPWIAEHCRIHDVRAEHYRNVLLEYDAVVYELGPGAESRYLHEPLVAWPGLVVVHGDDLDSLFDGDSRRTSAALDRATAVVVHSALLERRLRAEYPWAKTVRLELAGDFASVARGYLETLRRAPLAAATWLETLLETASAEIPGFFPGERSAPWRPELEELVALLAKRPS